MCHPFLQIFFFFFSSSFSRLVCRLLPRDPSARTRIFSLLCPSCAEAPSIIIRNSWLQNGSERLRLSHTYHDFAIFSSFTGFSQDFYQIYCSFSALFWSSIIATVSRHPWDLCSCSPNPQAPFQVLSLYQTPTPCIRLYQSFCYSFPYPLQPSELLASFYLFQPFSPPPFYPENVSCQNAAPSSRQDPSVFLSLSLSLSPKNPSIESHWISCQNLFFSPPPLTFLFIDFSLFPVSTRTQFGLLCYATDLATSTVVYFLPFLPNHPPWSVSIRKRAPRWARRNGSTISGWWLNLAGSPSKPNLSLGPATRTSHPRPT